MKIDVLTLFPGMFAGPLDESIIKRARQAGLLDLQLHQLRDWTHDRHKTVDDRPFGGGPGMLLKPEPIFEAVESLRRDKTRVVLRYLGFQVSMAVCLQDNLSYRQNARSRCAGH